MTNTPYSSVHVDYSDAFCKILVVDPANKDDNDDTENSSIDWLH